MLNLGDIYTDYLIAQNKHATATGLANLMPDELSHDQITRLLNKAPQTSKDLWLEVKSDVREHESADDGVLAIDDMIAEKPYSDENDIIAWHYDHCKGAAVKGVNLLTAMVRYGDVRLPIAYEVNKFAQNSISLSPQQATGYFGKLPLWVVMRFVFFAASCGESDPQRLN